MTTEAPDTPPKPTPKTFDIQLAEDLQAALTEVLLKHGGNVRSLGVAIDYHGELNEAPGIAKAVWMASDGGAVLDAGAVFGSCTAVAHLHSMVHNRTMRLTGQLQEQLAKGVEELGQLAEQHAKGVAPEES